MTKNVIKKLPKKIKNICFKLIKIHFFKYFTLFYRYIQDRI
jgi:hypothetical protein